jgi:hypothetical protein
VKKKLNGRQAALLAELTNNWVRPMDVATLKALVHKGFAECRRRDSLMNALGSARGSYVYRKSRRCGSQGLDESRCCVRCGLKPSVLNPVECPEGFLV